MSDEEIPNPIALVLPMGENGIEYPELPQGVHALEVRLKGMRNREIALKRVRPSEITRYQPGLRGMPIMYCFDFKRRHIRFFPAAVGTYTVLLYHGRPGALVEDDTPAVA